MIATASLATAQPGGSVLLGTLLEPDQKTPEVSTEELRRFLVGGQTLILDARPFLEYAVSHIPWKITTRASWCSVGLGSRRAAWLGRRSTKHSTTWRSSTSRSP